jgi:putative tricarboxylic transport membrane protein
MDTLVNVAHGFGVALVPINLLYCFIGVFIGTLVGVLPGIGPISAMSLLLPVTLSGTPESGIIMMAGTYYGSMYGGSTTSILVNIPGEAASVVTCIDGHEMAKQGRAGPALGISAFGSFFAGTFALVALMLVAPKLASVAIAFGPAEYFSLMVLGLVVLTFLTQGSMAKALLMACIGVVLGLIGLDSITAQPRLTFGRMELIDGIGLVPVVMGLFGLAEVLLNTEQLIRRDIINAKITQLLPNKEDWKAAPARSDAAPSSASSSAFCRAAARSSPPLRPMRWRNGCPKRLSDLATARSKAWRGRNPPTTRPPAAHSFR